MTRKVLACMLCVVMTFVLVGAPLSQGSSIITMPASISNVSYQYNDWVKFMDLSNVTKVGNSINIPASNLSVGDIVVDESGQNSLKILKVNADGTYITAKPAMIDLFSEFTIPRQFIEPNEANITEFDVKGISAHDYAAKLANESGSGETQKLMSGDIPSADMQTMYNLFNDRGSRIYEYDGDYTFSSFNLGSGLSSIKLHLDGALGVSPNVVASYSFSDGYEFGFVNAAQFIDLKANLSVQIDQEMYCPIFAIDLSIADIGAVRVGVYLVLDVDGDISMTIKAEEGSIATASVSGNTKYGIPTSFNINKSFESFSGAECDPMGYIHAGVYITPLVMLEILSVDVFDAQIRMGFYAYADFTENTLNYGVDFVIYAFVTILDDRTDLIKYNMSIFERSKSMRKEDYVIFYTSRLCSYQDRINVAAFTNRPSTFDDPYADPFSDKLPFSNRELEAWYYPSTTPDKPNVYTFMTDDNGCAQVNFKNWNVDVSKGDKIIIKSPGFAGQTDIIHAGTPFFNSGLYGYSYLRGDYFEDTVEFVTPSGKDLTQLDVPNSDVQFDIQQRIYYEGPVTVYSTDKTTNATEKAVFEAKRDVTKYTLNRTGLVPYFAKDYDIKPNNEMKWQINDSGFTYGTTSSSGAGGHETWHNIIVYRLTIDKVVPIEDYGGNSIGLQHNVALKLVAVNKGGNKPYLGTADLNVSLGEVPPDYVQGPLPPMDLGYVKFPAASVGYPNHYEYYLSYQFPTLLYESKGLPQLVLGSPENSDVGTNTHATYLWRWEEMKPDIPTTVSITKSSTITSPTGAPQTIYQEVDMPNIIYKTPADMNINEFTGLPITYSIKSPTAGTSVFFDIDNPVARSIYQMRHIVSGMSVTGVPLPDPPFSPPAPVIYDLDSLIKSSANAFNIEFQLEQMLKTDRYVVNPLSEWSSGAYKSFGTLEKNTFITKPTIIKNAASLPVWAADYVHAVLDNGIMKLDANGNFNSSQYTTRADFSAAIVNALGLSALDTVKEGFPFTDVSASDPNQKQMQIAYQCGIINGTSATTFSPNANITRQDAATMLIKAFSLRNTSLIPQNTDGLLSRFTDKGSVSNYAMANLEKSIALKLFSGYPNGTLMPRANIMNAQTAAIIWELKLKAEKPGLQW